MSSHSPQAKTAQPVHGKARRSFWVLVAVAILATGSLSRSLTAPPSPATGLALALSGLIALLAVSLAVRVMTALSRARR